MFARRTPTDSRRNSGSARRKIPCFGPSCHRRAGGGSSVHRCAVRHGEVHLHDRRRNQIGALAAHGIIPGPRLFTERAELAYTFMVGLSFTVVAMLIVGLLTIRWSSLIVRAPRTMMLPGVLVLATMGAYGLANSVFDVYVLMTVGVIAYFLAKVGVPPSRWRWGSSSAV